MNVARLSWLTRAELLSANINKVLLAHGLKFRDSFAAEMAVDLSTLPDKLPPHPGLRIVRVDDQHTLRQWIHIASVGFKISEKFEQVWYDFFADAIFEARFQTYLALLDGKPVGTSQLFLSEGVAGIYNVTCMPSARPGNRLGHHISSAARGA